MVFSKSGRFTCTQTNNDETKDETNKTTQHNLQVNKESLARGTKHAKCGGYVSEGDYLYRVPR